MTMDVVPCVVVVELPLLDVEEPLVESVRVMSDAEVRRNGGVVHGDKRAGC